MFKYGNSLCISMYIYFSSGRRLQKDDLGRAVARLDVTRLQCFICGPPPMIEDLQIVLRDLGVDLGCVNFEKWW